MRDPNVVMLELVWKSENRAEVKFVDRVGFASLMRVRRRFGSGHKWVMGGFGGEPVTYAEIIQIADFINELNRETMVSGAIVGEGWPAAPKVDVPMKTDLSSIPDTPAGQAFRVQMKDRDYSEAAMIQAWNWFESGYDAPKEGVPADDLLYVIEVIQEYCTDLLSGNYVREPGENPLQKIYDLLNIGKIGSIPRPKKEPVDGDEA